MKKKLIVIGSIVLLALSSVLGVAACDKDEGKTVGQIPVYQGMSISNGQSAIANHTSIVLTQAMVPGNHGNHNGWHKGDYEGKDQDINQEYPFPDNENDENIEEEIKSSLEVIGTGQEIYYATANEDIFINIYISNPDNYEIMSFTLNGKKYSSYMFEEGSDMETLVLKYNVGSNSGIQEYTIDAIKYIDGTDIKDAIMNGDKTVLAGIRADDQVNVTVSNITVKTNALSFAVKTSDDDNLISYSQGCLKAVIYDGENIIETHDLIIGDNNVTFSHLETSTLYQYAIVGYYDNLSGEGFVMNTLYKEAFYTKAIVLFDNVVISKEDIQFDFVWDSEFQNKTLTALKLYNGNVATDISVTETIISDLLSDTTYTLVAEYKNGEKTESIYLEFKTEVKATPVVEIASPVITDTSISAEYSFIASDNVGNVKEVSVYKGEMRISNNTEKEIDFTGLEYYTEYRIVIVCSYDLNDGKGIQEKTFATTYKTKPHLVFKTCKIINTSAVSEGDTIYMQATLDNPSGALPSSVVVNGKTYDCTSSTSASKIYLEIVNNGQFEGGGGNTKLVIEEINMTLDGEIYSIETNSNNFGIVFINGALAVESLQLVNTNGEIVDYCMPDDEVYLLLTLKNRTGYTIDRVSIYHISFSRGEPNTSFNTITSLIKIDDEHYRINSALSNGWNSYRLQAIAYHNDYINKTLQNIDTCSTNRVFLTNASDVINISIVEQLINTNYNGGYYKLTADIDLSGIEWTNLGAFNGVFDGNGHKILNMSNVSTVVNQQVRIGLFDTAEGIFNNVQIEDITIMITLKSTDSNAYSAYIGGIVATSYYVAVFKNCNVSGDISVNNNSGYSENHAGGLLGSTAGYVHVYNCEVNINISLKNGEKVIGITSGVIGFTYGYNAEIYIYNCTINGSISASTVHVITYVYRCEFLECKNNKCDIYLNGIRKTFIDDYSL